MPEILTDEQAAAIWSGQTASIIGLESVSTKTPEELAAEKAKTDATKVVDTKVEEKKEDDKTVLKDSDLDLAFGSTEVTETKDDDSTSVTTIVDDKKNVGRKVTDLVQVVNQMIDEDLLLAPADDKGDVIEIKTIEDAKKLIKSNLDYKEREASENWWDEKKKSFSPQVQAVLHYAEQGAQSATEIAQMLGAIQQVEDAAEIDIKTPAGQERTVRETYKAKGFKDTYIDKQVNILKDLGGDKLKEEAEELYPELLTMKQEQVKQYMQDQDRKRKEAEDASKIYVSTVKQTLDKEVIGGVKFTREEKAKLYEAVTQPNYMSLNGTRTNLFVKTLEELQFGKNADYEQYMNIVQFAIDPKGFVEKLRTSVSNQVADETFRKLKTAKSTSANTDNTETINRTQVGAKKTITKTGFVNPYA